MKKSLLFLTLFLCLTSSLFCQSNLFVGGSMGMGLSSHSTSSTGLTYNSNNYTFEISPLVGYCINDKFSVGAFLGYNISGSSGTSSAVYLMSSSKSTSSIWGVSLNPFLRYNVFEYNNLSLIGQASMGIGFENEKYNSSGNAQLNFLNLGISPIISFKINDKISIETSVAALGLTRSSYADGSGNTSNLNFSINTGLNLGFTYKL